MAPFPLLTYQDAKKRARQIADATRDRAMPPWLPEHGFGRFADERRLSNEEIETIRRWVDAGAPEGTASDVPAPSSRGDAWQIGTPDLVVTTSEPYRLPAGSGDVYRNFVIPIPITGSRFVRAVELRPDNPTIVHHARLLVDRTGASRRLDDEDPGPGYDGMRVDDAQFPDGHFLGWSPGKIVSPNDDAFPWRLDQGTDLVVQLHLRPTSTAETIGVAVGFLFTDRAPARTPFVLTLESKTIDIPPGAAHDVVEDTYSLPVAVQALRIYPHAHYLATDMKAFADLPDGSRQWLLWIKRWDLDHQDEYRYAEPVPLPAGTTITMRFTYDNSAANPMNPSRPPRRVMYGPRASDEMAELLLQVLPADSNALAVLEGDAARKRLQARLAGDEQRLRAEPTNAAIHRSLVSGYLRLGAIPTARAHADEAVRLEPESPYAHAALGSALAAQGQFAGAVAEYRRALATQPSLAEAHDDLGVALQSLGRVDEAIAEYREALRLRPASASAHNNLGNALAAKGLSGEAIREYRSALELDPGSAEAHNNLGTAFLRQDKLEDAVSEYRRAVAIAPSYAEAYDNLGLALRRQGHLEQAIDSFMRALRIQPRYAEALNNLGDAFMALGNVPAAIDELRQALSVKPHYALAHNNLGAALASKGDVASATDEYREAIRIAPEYVEARTNLGNALATLGRLDEAAEQLREALRTRPDYAAAHGNLATVLMLDGRFDEATAEFREALRLTPDSPSAMAGLAWVIATRPNARSRDAEESVRLAERAVDLTSRRSAVILDTLGASYAAAGRFDRAVATAQAAVAQAVVERNDELAARIRMRVELYKKRKPYVENAAAAAR